MHKGDDKGRTDGEEKEPDKETTKREEWYFLANTCIMTQRTSQSRTRGFDTSQPHTSDT